MFEFLVMVKYHYSSAQVSFREDYLGTMKTRMSVSFLLSCKVKKYNCILKVRGSIYQINEGYNLQNVSFAISFASSHGHSGNFTRAK